MTTTTRWLAISLLLALADACDDDDANVSDAPDTTEDAGGDEAPPDTPLDEGPDADADSSADLSAEAEAEASAEADADAHADVDPDALTPFGTVDLTYYWVSYEGDFAGSADTDIGDCSGAVLATVTNEFARALRLEGSGRLLDGRMLNIGGCSCGSGFFCFAVLDPALFPWGMGSRDNALVPFVSIATDTSVLAAGTIVYAPDLDGLALPDATTHDGCLRADDIGGGIVGLHIDWFVGLQEHYLTLDPLVPETLDLFLDAPHCAYLGM